MQRPGLVFALFATAILFSMVREWRAPIACPRPSLPTEEIRSTR